LCLLRDNDCHDDVDKGNSAEAGEENQQSQQADDGRWQLTNSIQKDLTTN